MVKKFKQSGLSKIDLVKKREAEIESCFDCVVKFHYRKDKNSFKKVLEQFKLQPGKDKNSFKKVLEQFKLQPGKAGGK